jgi:hypothetical protein
MRNVRSFGTKHDSGQTDTIFQLRIIFTQFVQKTLKMTTNLNGTTVAYGE